MKRLCFVICLMVSMAAGVFAGTSILIYNFKSTGLDEATTDAVRELFKSDLAEKGYSPLDAGGEVCGDDRCASAGAEKFGAEQALYGSLAKLGEKIIVNIYVADRAGKSVHSDKLTAETVEDLDVVMERLSQGIAEGKKAADVIDKTDVTVAESNEPKRRKNFYTVGVKIGYRFPLGDSYGKDQMWDYEAVAMYETEKLFVEGRGYGSSGGDATAFGLSIGTFYIFSPKDFSPYVGGSAGIEWVMDMPYILDEGDSSFTGGASGNGPALSIGGGLMAFQTYDFRLMLDLRYSIVFVGEADIDFDDFARNDTKQDMGTQHSLAITLGIMRRDVSGRERSSLCCMPW